MIRLRVLFAILMAAAGAVPAAVAQVDSEFQALHDWVWTGADAARDVSPNAAQERWLVAGSMRSRVSYGDFVLRFEYRVPGPAAGGELLVRSGVGDRASRYAYAVTLTKDRTRGRITAVGQKLGDSRHDAPTADAGDTDWVACEVRAAGDALTVRLDGVEVGAADRLDVDAGLLVFRANGPGSLEVRGLRISHVPAASTGPPAAADDRTATVDLRSPGTTPPGIVRNTAPEYPARLRRERVTGMVLLEGVVGSDGVLRHLRVVTSPHPDFSTQAIACASQWRFSPATKDGVPVPAKVKVEVAFNLAPPQKK